MMSSLDILSLIIFVQIVAESLPISSSSHVHILTQFFGATVPTLPDYFDHVLHGPTILIILLFFRNAWYDPLRFLLRGLVAGRFSYKKLSYSTRSLLNIFFRLVLFMVITTGVAGLFYAFIHGYAKHQLWFASVFLMVFGMVVTMVCLFFSRYLKMSHQRSFDSFVAIIKPALALGVVQGCALFPGISRFASTYVAARYLHFSQKRAFQLSFLIQFPLIVAAFFINGLPGLHAFQGSVNFVSIKICSVVLVSSICAYAAFSFVWWLVKRDHFWKIGFYLLIPITLVLIGTLASSDKTLNIPVRSRYNPENGD